MESEQGQQLTGKQVDLMEIDVDEQQELAMQYKVSNKTSRGGKRESDSEPSNSVGNPRGVKRCELL